MSKCESQLRHFLKTLPNESAFPKQSINNFIAMTPFNATEFLNIYDENWQHYLTNIQQYREVTMLLYIGLSKNVNGMIENAIEFIEGMILSRLIMLIFNQKLEFQGDKVILYLEPTVELTVIRSLESGKEQFLVSILQRINSKKHIFNEIGFLLELVFIKKIQKFLEEPSLFEFNELLKSFMHSKKISRLFGSQNALHFKQIVILRQEQQKQDTYYLQFMNGGKLIKLKQSFTMNVLPNWVQQAYWTMPKTLNLQQFRSMSVMSVFCLLSYVEVFASSPFIEQFTCYTTDETFLTIFEQFLMGVNISSQPYQFHWEKMKKSLEIIRKNSQNQNPCYKVIIAEQMINTVKNTKSDESITRK